MPGGPTSSSAPSSGPKKNRKKPTTILGWIQRWFEDTATTLNESKVFAGVMIVSMNIAARFATVKMGKTTENFLRTYLTKNVIIFLAAWMGTRDITKAIILALVVILVMDVFLDDDSPACVIPKQYRALEKAMDFNGDGVVDEDEVKRAIEILEKDKKKHEQNAQKNAIAKLQGNMAAGFVDENDMELNRQVGNLGDGKVDVDK